MILRLAASAAGVGFERGGGDEPLFAHLPTLKQTGAQERADALLGDAEPFSRVLDGEKIRNIHFGMFFVSVAKSNQYPDFIAPLTCRQVLSADGS